MDSDARLKRLERWLQELYSNAEKEMRGKWDKYMEKAAEREKSLLSRITEAKTPEEKEEARETHKKYVKSSTKWAGHYRKIVEGLANQYHDANVRAAEIVNGERAEFFADGYNLSAETINEAAVKSNVGISFELCDADTVNWLAERQNDLILPGPSEPKAREDMTWNIRNINSQVAQGIVQGESIPKIAARLRKVSDMNVKSSIRNARTMATACENAGRVESMKRAEEWGVMTRKKWLCTHDGRTRHSHLIMDGETVADDEWFSNDCRFPGDPLGPAAEVYNCRCTLITVIDGFSSNLPKGKEDAIKIWVDGERVK